MTAVAEDTATTVGWPTQPGHVYEGYAHGQSYLHVAGWGGWVRLFPDPYGTCIGLYRPEQQSDTYTQIAGHPDVVRSVALTILIGAARAAGVTVHDPEPLLPRRAR